MYSNPEIVTIFNQNSYYNTKYYELKKFQFKNSIFRINIFYFKKHTK